MVTSEIRFQKLSLIINGLKIEKCNLILISKKFRALRAFRGQIPSKDKNGRGLKGSFQNSLSKVFFDYQWVTNRKMQSNFDFKKISCPSCLSWTNPLKGQKWARPKKVISKIPFQKFSLIINGLQIEKSK